MVGVRLRGWRVGDFRIQEGNRDPLGFVDPVVAPEPPSLPDLNPDPFAIPFVDPMSRGPRKLQTVPAYEYDHSLVNALYTKDQQLECQTADAQGATYKSPNLGSTLHYVQFLAVGSAANGPLVCCRFADADNWVGVRRNGTNVVIVKSINGVETTIHNVNHNATAATVIRLSVEEDSFKLVVDGNSTVGIIGAPSLTSTRQGFLARGAFLNPWLDNYEAGFTTPFIIDGPDPNAGAVPFKDDFNRGDRALETTTAWTSDGFAVGTLKTVANSLTETGTATTSAFWSPNLAKVNHYVQFKSTADAATGPYVICHAADRDNWIGVRRNGTNAQIAQSVAGVLTELYNTNQTLTSASIIKLSVKFKYSGLTLSTWELHVNAVSVATGKFNSALQSTRQGILSQGPLLANFIDDYEAGTLTDPLTDPNPANTLIFVDNFDRDNRNLETVPAWTHDGVVAGAAKTVDERLATSTVVAPGSIYRSPDVGVPFHYIRAVLPTSLTGVTPMACTRLQDANNWLGVRRNGENVQVIESVNGVETILHDMDHNVAPTHDVVLISDYLWADKIRSRWTLWVTGFGNFVARVDSPNNGNESTRTGILVRGTAVDPWLDRFDSGSVAAPPVRPFPDVNPNAAAVPFLDDFNRQNRTLETVPAWSHDGLVLNALRTSNAVNTIGDPPTTTNTLTANTVDASGSAYKSPDLASQHNYVQFVALGSVTTAAGPMACVRLSDRNNWIGIRRNGTAVVVSSNIAGTVTQLFSGGTATSADTLRLDVSNVTWIAKVNGAQVGSGIVPQTQPASTRVGLVGRGTLIDPWMNNYESNTITFTAGADPSAVAVPFIDGFDRGNRYLETVPAWTHDSAVLGAAVSFDNRLAANSTAVSLYKMPAQTFSMQYAQAKFVGTTVGPVVVVRSTDKNNWLGMSRNGTNIDILQSLSGVVSTLTSVAATATATDNFRLNAHGNRWTLQKNLVDIGAGDISPLLLANTGIGVAPRTAVVNPWIDDFEGGSTVFRDNFNRANENLEASLNWTHDGQLAGAAKIVGNNINADTTNSLGSLYQSPDCNSANHYAQVLFTGSSPAAAGCYVVCRAVDRNNWIGIHRDGTSIVVRQTVAGTGSNLSTIATSANTTSTYRLECSGTAWNVKEDGISIGTGTINAALTGTRTGLLARFHAITSWVDDYEAGAL